MVLPIVILTVFADNITVSYLPFPISLWLLSLPLAVLIYMYYIYSIYSTCVWYTQFLIQHNMTQCAKY